MICGSSLFSRGSPLPCSTKGVAEGNCAARKRTLSTVRSAGGSTRPQVRGQVLQVRLHSLVTSRLVEAAGESPIAGPLQSSQARGIQDIDDRHAIGNLAPQHHLQHLLEWKRSNLNLPLTTFTNVNRVKESIHILSSLHTWLRTPLRLAAEPHGLVKQVFPGQIALADAPIVPIAILTNVCRRSPRSAPRKCAAIPRAV